MGTKRSGNSLPKELRKRQVDEHEIEQIRDGLPKVIEYWNMVKQEMDELLDKAKAFHVE
jgi:hypothetical protein